MATLQMAEDKKWTTQVSTFRTEPIMTIADVYFSAPGYGHRISVDVAGDDELKAFLELHSRLVLYGMYEVAEIVMEEIDKRR